MTTGQFMMQRIALSILKGRGIASPDLLNRALVYNRLGWAFRFLYTRSLRLSAYWPLPTLEKIQEVRLRYLLKRAADTIPFWTELLSSQRESITSVSPREILKSLPILQKSDLRRHILYCINPLLSQNTLSVDWLSDYVDGVPPHFLVDGSFFIPSPGIYYGAVYGTRHEGGYMLTKILTSDRAIYPPVKTGQCFCALTSGSTGEPLKFLLDTNFAIRIAGFYRRIFDMTGGESGDIFIRFSIVDRPFFLGTTYFPCLNISDVPARLSQLQAFLKGRRAVLYAPSSFLIEIARLLQKKGSSLNLRSVIAASEGISPEEQRFVEKTLSCKLFRVYTTRELGYLAQECEKGGLHVNAEWAYIEIVNEAGNNVPPDTTGRIIVTVFDNFVMPFIRYETGDLGMFLSRPCSCGRTLPLLNLIGRKIGLLHLPGGKKMHHFELLRCFFDDQRRPLIRSFQIIQEAKDRITILIVPENNFSKVEAASLSSDLLKLLGNNVRVEIKMVDGIASTGWKRRAFISKLPTES